MTAAGTFSQASALASDWPGNFWLHLLVFALIILAFVLLTVIIVIWLERRLIGRIQVRPGPNRAGPFGLLQPIADMIKILTKEDIVPGWGDRLVFWLAPLVAFVPVLLIFAVVPFWNGALLADLNIGILYILAVSSVASVGIFMAGWSSGNKYALIGAMRNIAQLISYEIPMVISLAAVVLVAGSLSLNEIVAAQDIPYILIQPLGFTIFFIAALAEANRTPFDLVEADSEIVAGFNIEYSGMKFASLMLTEYAEVVAISAIATSLFLGGWRGPFLPPFLWFVIKMFAVFFVLIWIRGTLPRLRIDQVMAFAWKFLLPLALINLVVTGAQVLFWPQAPYWSLVLINVTLLVALLLLWSRFFRLGGSRVGV